MLNNIKNSNKELTKIYAPRKKIKRRYLEEKHEGKVKVENVFTQDNDSFVLRKMRSESSESIRIHKIKNHNQQTNTSINRQYESQPSLMRMEEMSIHRFLEEFQKLKHKIEDIHEEEIKNGEGFRVEKRTGRKSDKKIERYKQKMKQSGANIFFRSLNRKYREIVGEGLQNLQGT